MKRTNAVAGEPHLDCRFICCSGLQQREGAGEADQERRIDAAFSEPAKRALTHAARVPFEGKGSRRPRTQSLALLFGAVACVAATPPRITVALQRAGILPGPLNGHIWEIFPIETARSIPK
jgi:hypothetical protein